MNDKTEFQKFIKSMSTAELDEYASNCQTTTNYIVTHLYHAYKIPRKKLLKNLAVNSGGVISEPSLIDHFYKSVA